MKTLIILGCKDYRRMHQRVSEFADLIKDGDRVILSGTKQEVAYLIQIAMVFGIDDSIIDLEQNSYDTLTNMLFSFKMVKTKDVLICTDKTHIGRATTLAVFVNNIVRNGDLNILYKHKIITKYKKNQFKRFYLNVRGRGLWFF